jgi:chromosome segregation ATPase
LSSTLTELSKTVETMRAAAAKDGAELEKLRALLREGEASLAEEKRLRAAAERSADSSSADAEHRLKMQAVEADRRLAEVVVRTRAEAEAEHRSNLSALQDSHARDREALLSDLKTQKARAQVAEDQLTELTKRRAAEAGEDQQARQDQERVRASQRELEALRTDLSDLQARHASASEARVKAAAELEAARAQAEAAGRERDSLQEALAQTALAAQTAEGEAAQLRTAALLCKQELDALAADYRKLRASVDPSAESPSEAALRRGKAVAEVLTT